MSNTHNHGSLLYIINVHTENLRYHYYPVKIASLSGVRLLSIDEAHIWEVLFLTYKGRKDNSCCCWNTIWCHNICHAKVKYAELGHHVQQL